MFKDIEFIRNKDNSLTVIRKENNQQRFVTSITAEAQVKLLERAFAELFEEWKKQEENILTEWIAHELEQNKDSKATSDNKKKFQAFLAKPNSKEVRSNFEKFESIFCFIKLLREIEARVKNKKNKTKKIKTSIEQDKADLAILDNLWNSVKEKLFLPYDKRFFLSLEFLQSMNNSKSPILYITGEEKCDISFLRVFFYYTYEKLYAERKEKIERDILQRVGVMLDRQDKKKSNQEIEEEEDKKLDDFVRARHKKELQKTAIEDDFSDDEEILGKPEDNQPREEEEDYSDIEEDYSDIIVAKDDSEDEYDDILKAVEEKRRAQQIEEFEREKEELTLACINRANEKRPLERKKICDQEILSFIQKMIADEIETIKDQIKSTKYGRNTGVEKIRSWNNLSASLNAAYEPKDCAVPFSMWKAQRTEHDGNRITNEKLMATHRRFKFFQMFKKTDSTQTLETISKLINKIQGPEGKI